VALIDENDEIVAVIVENGVVSPDAPAKITMVTLNFLANGGDGYPMKANGENFRFLLNDGTLSAPVDEALNFTAVGVVPANILGEQQAMSDYVQERYATPQTAFDIADTDQTGDTRIQNLDFREDTVLDETAFTLQILHYYGESGLLGVDTAPIMGAMIDKFDDEYANTLVLAEGDNIIPGPWLIAGADPSLNAVPGIGTTALGRPDYAIMNAFGTDASALGNHEFDLGSPVFQSAIQASGSGSSAWVGAQFPHITSNLTFAADSSLRGLADATLGGTGTNAFAGKEASTIKGKIAPYTVVTQGTEKIGIVGSTTFELLSKSSPNGTRPLDDGNPATSDLQEVAAYLQATIDALKAAGINKIVMVDQLDTLHARILCVTIQKT
jgi:2',3'-cyclic-nucleotide 2'-phosphodiesterase (5'-nucleotidase family)